AMYQKMPSAGVGFGCTLGTVPHPIPVSPRRQRAPVAAIGCVTLEEGDERSVTRSPLRSRAWQSADRNWRTGAYTLRVPHKSCPHCSAWGAACPPVYITI